MSFPKVEWYRYNMGKHGHLARWPKTLFLIGSRLSPPKEVEEKSSPWLLTFGTPSKLSCGAAGEESDFCETIDAWPCAVRGAVLKR